MANSSGVIMIKATRARRPAGIVVRLGVSAVLAVAVVGVTTPAASAATCSVKNHTTSVSYSDLQTAVTAASNGDTLRVGGTCSAPVVITKNLTLTNRVRGVNGVIQGAHLVTPLSVAFGATVVVRNLTLVGGGGFYPYSSAYLGGGIFNQGSLTLDGTTLVTGNTASYGGGIFNEGGFVHVTGHTRITNNFYSGIANYFGVVVVNGHAVVSGNDGAGIVNTKGSIDGTGSATLSLSGHALVTGNTGGGVVNDCLASLTVIRRARVVGNTGGDVVTTGTSTFCNAYITE
jgi:hypothetical protein